MATLVYVIQIDDIISMEHVIHSVCTSSTVALQYRSILEEHNKDDIDSEMDLFNKWITSKYSVESRLNNYACELDDNDFLYCCINKSYLI